jgi:RNA polymerase sigma factor (sigma-70 family)
MATAPVSTLLRHIQKLGAEERTDRQLLEDFAARRDESAFAALVARHGPMVLRVCGRVLGHEQDAEDAFQATFLVLAGNSAAIRKREALAEWLHGVAYRTAMRARRSAARRRNHEARLRSWKPEAAPGPNWEDVQAVLDEEICRLSGPFRAAFTLCVLEGKTGPEVAAVLGCKEGTVASRLARARKQLQRQLLRRGIQLSALAAALGIVEGAGKAAVPAPLAEATIRSGLLVAAGAPTAGKIPSHVAALAAGVTRAMFLSRVRIATVLLLVLSLVAGAGVLSLPGNAADDTAQRPPDPAATPPAADAAKTPDKEVLACSGQVLGPDGRPVPGAKLYLTPEQADDLSPPPAAPVATTGPDGRFEVTVRKGQFRDHAAVLTAAAANHGVAWVRVPPPDGNRLALTLRLADDVAITGQIVDLEGKPVPGATLTVRQLRVARGDDLGPWLEAVQGKRGLSGTLEMRYFTRFPGALSGQATTDAEGRFRLAGMGRGRLVTLLLEGPGIASQDLHVLTRPGKALEVPDRGRPRSARWVTTYYASAFRHVAAPARPVAGVVRDRDTKKPLPGVTIQSVARPSNSFPGRYLLRTVTDEQGRYRLPGLPKGGENPLGEERELHVVPPDNLPYLVERVPVPDSPGLDPIPVDIGLKRGVWIEGKITDKVTGKPLRGAVTYVPLHSDENLRDYPGFGPAPLVDVHEDGLYRIVGMPGPGLVAVYPPDAHYLRYADRDDEFGSKEFLPVASNYRSLAGSNCGAFARVDPARGAEVVKRDVTLDPGWSFTGTVTGPDGKPLAGARGFGLVGGVWDPEVRTAAEFTGRFNPHGPADIFFHHPEKGLVGVVPPPRENGGAVTVRLEPGASVTGRLVDADGKPRAGVELQVSVHLTGDGWVAYPPRRLATDGEGRFRVEALLPGHEFRMKGDEGELSLGVAPRPGQAKDLGDVRLRQPVED